MNNWVITYARMVVRFRWLVIFLSIAGTLSLASGMQFIKFTNDYRYFFTNQNPNLQAFEKLERTYTSPDSLLWVLQPEKGLVTDKRVLEAIKIITDRAWQTPYSIRVDSLTNFQHTRASEDDLVVRDLVADPGLVTPRLSEEIKAIALNEPVIAKRLIASDARTTAVVATLKLPRDDQKAIALTIKHARETLKDIREKYPDIRFEITGSTALSNAFSEASQNDLRTLTPTMYVVLALTVFLLTRSIPGTIATVFVVTLSAAAAMGLVMGWIGIPLSPPSSGAPTVILTVAVAGCIHILVTMLVEMRKGKTRHEAIVESIRINWQPVFLTSLTTAIGFASLNFSDAPPFRDLGNTSAVGTLIAWALSVTFLPAILAILPVKAKETLERQTSLMERFAELVIHRHRIIFTAMIILIAGLAAMLPQLTFNDRFVTYFDKRVEFRVASDWAADNLTGIYQVSYSLGSGESGGVANPEYLATLEAFANHMRTQPEVVHVAAFSDIMKRVNKSMNADNQDFYRVPDKREMAAQYLLLYEMSLPYGLDLNDQVNVDKSATKMTLTLTDVSTAEMHSLIGRGEKWLKENAPEYMYSYPAGQAVMFSSIGRNNFDAMKWGTGVALVLISGCLMLALRNLRLGIISLVPNLTPPLAAFGLLAIFSSEVGFWSTFVISTALGLIVDATIHFLSKYRRARIELGHDAQDGVRYAFSTVGTALWVSTFVLIAGFLILALSPFKVNAMLGLMVAVTVGVALIIDFLLLPSLLILTDKKSREKEKAGAPAIP